MQWIQKKDGKQLLLIIYIFITYYYLLSFVFLIYSHLLINLLSNSAFLTKLESLLKKRVGEEQKMI